VVPYYKLVQALHEEGVKEDGLPRVLKLVSLDENEDADFTEFRQLSNVIFNEALSVITFAYMIRGRDDGLHAQVDLQTVENAILKIFNQLDNLYPAPRCEDIEFLFEQSDKNKDCYLNIQEFHYLLSVFLRYYKSGIQSNEYANIIFHDHVFADLWVPGKNSEPLPTQESQTGSTVEASETIDGVTEPGYYSEPSSELVTESDVTIGDYPSETEVTEATIPYEPATESQSEPEATEATPSYETEVTEATESTIPSEPAETETVAEPEATESTPAGTSEAEVTEDSGETEGDTFGFSYYYPSTEETEKTEASESTPTASEASETIGKSGAAASAPTGTEGAETESEPAGTEAAETEGDTFGFSYYYPATEETEATRPTITGAEGAETEPTESTPTYTYGAATEGDGTETEETEATGGTEPVNQVYE